jgi:LacI family transcriptional regulator
MLSSVAMEKRPARLEDVARDAGVHTSTVSRVLNRRDTTIPAETQKRIIESARKLRYRPHAMGRGLRLASTGALGVFGGSLRNPLWSQIIHGAFEQARKRGYVVLIAEDSGEDSGFDVYERLVSEAWIDGLLALSGNTPEWLLRRISESGFPTVFAGRGLPGSERNVLMDEAAAVGLALSFLVSGGHQAIGYIEGPAALDTTHRRVEALRRLWGEQGLTGEVTYALSTEQAGYEAALALLERTRPSACIVANFPQLIGALAAARRLKLKVPGDLTLVTYDDEPMLDYLDGAVTAVRMPMFELGAAGIDALIEQIEGKPRHDIVLELPPKLVHRGQQGLS